ncbi:hypothetical protein MASR2M29_11930 [Spirochaetota bacterium]
MKKNILLVLLLTFSIVSVFSESSSVNIDFVIFIDTSLSMVDAIAEARQFVAGEIVGRLAVAGDWLSIYKFYGKSELLWEGYINGEADVAGLVRKLNTVNADGRFTDIGSALDIMEELLEKRGLPDRPKYILLVTDERQEAPTDSRYYSATYTIEHPMLEYIKRVDMGLYRVITIGYGLSAKVELETRSLLTTLSEAPARTEQLLPGANKAEILSASEDLSSDRSAADHNSSEAPKASNSKSSGEAQTQLTGQGARQGARQGALQGALVAALIAGAAAVGLLAAIMFMRRKKNRDNSRKEENKESPL